MRDWMLTGMAAVAGMGWAAAPAVAADTKPATTPAGRLVKLLDADGDGKIAEKEFKDGFAKVDSSGDGVLTQDELVKVLKEKPKTGNATGKTPSARLWELLDADADGKVTKDEYGRAFTKLDKDGDGSLTEEELKGALEPAPKKKK